MKYVPCWGIFELKNQYSHVKQHDVQAALIRPLCAIFMLGVRGIAPPSVTRRAPTRPARRLYPVHTSCPSPISSKTRVPCYAKISPTGPRSPSCPLCKPAATKPQQQAQRLRPEHQSHSDDCPKRRGSSATWTLLPRRRISITPEPPNAYVLPRLSALA